MKLVLDEDDQDFIDNFTEICTKRPSMKAVEQGKIYSFDFKVIDEAKANNFFYAVFPSKRNESEEFTEATGIQITRFNLDVNRSLYQARKLLKDALDSIDREIYHEGLIHGTDEGYSSDEE